MANNINLNQLLEELNEVKDKLYEYIETKGINIEKPLSEYTDTSSKAFKKWFLNSLVVDKNGEPLIVYHGTNAYIASFYTDLKDRFTGIGAFFSSNFETAKSYGEKVYPVYLSLQTPLIIDVKGMNWNEINSDAEVLGVIAYFGINPDDKLPIDEAEDEIGEMANEISPDDAISTNMLADAAEQQDYDGAIFLNVIDKAPEGPNIPTNTYVAFNPDQIKSIYKE